MSTFHDLTERFADRHIGPRPDDLEAMLDVIGVASVDALIDETMPAGIRDDQLDLPPALSEGDAIERLRAYADRNQVLTSLIGMGYSDTVVPPVVLRNVLENPAWYTAYTPYQPEISQGRLETLVNFQTMVCDLTGLDLANSSLLDEATAAAEAMALARRTVKGDRSKFFVHHDVHPQTLAVLRTRAEPVGVRLVVGDDEVLRDDTFGDDLFGALFSYPTSTGALTDWSTAIDRVHDLGGLAVVATDLLACVLLRSPGALGADVAIGSAQRFGVPLGFGGPHAGFMAVRSSAARSLPGRLVGVSTDTGGRPALRLALQTREQHIRREKATSNICTAQVLLANMAGLYASWHGPAGLRRIAGRVHGLARLAATALSDAGCTVRHDTYFDTVTVDLADAGAADAVMAAALDHGVNLRRVDEAAVGFTLDETTTPDIVERLLTAFGVERTDVASAQLDAAIPADLERDTPLLPHAAFNSYHSEHEMLRYLRRLADRDLALDRTMIPLGSCTMKLNATSEMEPITWPEFSSIHPAAPDEQTAGYRAMIAELEGWLSEITGYAAVSVQPNAGSQGEFAGLLAIRAYHRSRGDDQRTVCLIPSSAHGTNAASAVMAGLDVAVVACDTEGNIDLDDLDAKIAASGDRLAGIMITYPSTHGVFETEVQSICAKVHDGGGQVYVDGANLNAMVGLARPGRFGADVSHLNLHKTFCIPHGGGGPGVGPVGVREHLVPFLPGDPFGSDESPVGPVSAAPYGSAGILPIPWMYISMMGPDGLRRATEYAIVAANYVASRLDAHFPVLYTGAAGRVAHECIIDLREITRTTGVTVDDVAKRLIDYGFHAPTMSFPVAGTLMIEPTESEERVELDRFCDAMIAIRGEIDRIADGVEQLDQSALRMAPHTATDLIGEWDRSYSREAAAYPLPSLRQAKYFPPVSRIDGAYGDRHLVCSCEPLEAYATDLVLTPTAR
ncbi:MAG: glycine dehydrogenase (aminomethyl-transferring) [Acidimicrobiaceae bacterium]|nr:glycine dehydrogenase (aminomethyl-transferring) [Acidimicrobiaceae bacterium]